MSPVERATADENLHRAASWTWRLLALRAALPALLALLWYVRVIVLPIAVALTIAPALSPASSFRGRRHLERAAAALALLVGLAFVGVLVSIVTVSVVEQFDELVDSVARAVNDIVDMLEGEPFNLTLADDFRSSLEDTWRHASGYAASRVQAGAGLVTGIALAVAMLYFVLRDGGVSGRRSCGASRPTLAPRSIVPAAAPGTRSAASFAQRLRSRRSTRC